MGGGQFVREARRRAGLTQRQLASRTGVSQAAVARIESGQTGASLERIVQLVRACGFDLDIHLVPLDEDLLALAEQSERRTPDERLDLLLSGIELLEAGRRARGEDDG